MAIKTSINGDFHEVKARFREFHDARAEMYAAKNRADLAEHELTKTVFSAGMFEVLKVNHSRLAQILRDDR